MESKYAGLIKGYVCGQWVVISPDSAIIHRALFSLCRCSCGHEQLIENRRIVINDAHSCRKCANKGTPKHNKYKTRLYSIWKNMRSRCYIKGNNNYPHYGARGITICKAWGDFMQFYSWSMENGYADNLTIDRHNNNGNYEPSNCRWVTQAEQLNNTRRNLLLTYERKTMTLKQWSKKTSTPYGTMRYRYKHGWEPMEVLYGKI
jgi:hypothetical protein